MRRFFDLAFDSVEAESWLGRLARSGSGKLDQHFGPKHEKQQRDTMRDAGLVNLVTYNCNCSSRALEYLAYTVADIVSLQELRVLSRL